MPPKLRIAMPVRVFLYTVDQVSAILNIDEEDLMARYLYFTGLSTGIAGKRMTARNVEIDPDLPPRWRVAESEVLRYLRARGYAIDQGRIV